MSLPAPIRRYLHARPRLYRFARWLARLYAPMAMASPVAVARGWATFARDLRQYRRMAPDQRLEVLDWHPYLFDRSAYTPVATEYFYQDTWAAGKVFAARPAVHVDIGSTALLVGILAQFTKVVSVDVRPLPVTLPGLVRCAGSLTGLPLASRSVHSLSSLCVLEHVGLGRYGDSLDPDGSDVAATELQRVLAPRGNLYVSVPVEATDRVYFNAHRVFAVDGFPKRLPELTLIESRFIQAERIMGAEETMRTDFRRFVVFALYHFQRLSM